MHKQSNDNILTDLEIIINESGAFNFQRKQGSWGRFENACEIVTGYGWKMGMCKSSSGKDNAINRMYTTGAIRSYPNKLIQCLFLDDFIEDISEVYRNEFGNKMRCSPIFILVSQNENKLWLAKKILVQDKHPLMPLNKEQISKYFPHAELECVETIPLIPTVGWASDTQFTARCLDHEWGEVVIVDTGTNTDGFFTEIRQSCRNQLCEETRKGVVQGNIEWQLNPW
mgnify:FL=1|jgi:hypothetical protein